MPDTLRLHRLPYTRLPHTSLSTGVCSTSCPLSQWYYLTILPSTAPFSCPQSLPTSGSFPVSWLFASGGQSTEVSASVFPMNIQDWFPVELEILPVCRIDWFDLLAVQGTLKSFLQHHRSKVSILWHSAFFMVLLSYFYMTTGKTIDLTTWTFVGKVMSLLFNTISRFVIDFFPRSKRLSVSWLHSPFTVTLEPKKIKSTTVSIFSHLFAIKWWDQMSES